MKDERERGAILNNKLQTAEVELSERLETIESLKTEMAKHKDVAEKSKCHCYNVSLPINLFISKSNQDKISPHNIDEISSRQVMRT